MSVEIELNIEDYRSIISWYELAFGKDHVKQKSSDLSAFKKITVMCEAKIEELKDNEKTE